MYRGDSKRDSIGFFQRAFRKTEIGEGKWPKEALTAAYFPSDATAENKLLLLGGIIAVAHKNAEREFGKESLAESGKLRVRVSQKNVT